MFIYMREEKEMNKCKACLLSKLKNQANTQNLGQLFSGSRFVFAEFVQIFGRPSTFMQNLKREASKGRGDFSPSQYFCDGRVTISS